MSNINAARDALGKYSETHNLTNHEFYPIWRAMIGRCYNESNKSYNDYGARGIGVCGTWKESPKPFIEWLIDNGYSNGLQLDRIDNEKGYSPGKCRVVTRSENCRNRRNSVYVDFDGVRTLLIELSERTGIKYATLYRRIFKAGMTPEDAATAPLRGK